MIFAFGPSFSFFHASQPVIPHSSPCGLLVGTARDESPLSLWHCHNGADDGNDGSSSGVRGGL
jgi:hypothetical protein